MNICVNQKLFCYRSEALTEGVAFHKYSSFSSYGSTTFNAKFWPSQPVPSIFFYPGQGFSNLELLTSVYLF
jgi:hypothetical protein